MMQFEENNSTSIPPGKALKQEAKIEEVEKLLVSLIAEKQFSLLDTYNKYSASSSIAIYRDTLKNLEEYYKNLNLENDNQKVILSKIFETLKCQFGIIESLGLDNKTEEILMVLFVTSFLHIKRLLS